MADVVVKLKIMLESPDSNVESVKEKAKEKIEGFGGYVGKMELEDVAFGIKAVIIIFSYDEKKGDSEPLEKEINSIEGVRNAEVVDVRRAFG